MMKTGKHSKSGFTLLEVMIAICIMATVLVAVYGMLMTSSDTHQTGMSISDVESITRRTVDQISDELISTGTAMLNPNPAPPTGSSGLTYYKNTGYAGYAIQWGNPMRIEYQDDPTDPVNGQDDNANGLVDEGLVVFRSDFGLPSEENVIWARDVRAYLEGETANGADDNVNGLTDERGLSFDLVGETLTIRLTLERRDARGFIITRTVTTAVKLRN